MRTQPSKFTLALAFVAGIVAGILTATPAAVAQDNALATASSWVNQNGSVMSFSLMANGTISGTYVNNAPGFQCQGTPYPLTGFINGNTIAWSVQWNNANQNCNSVTAWGGYYDANAMMIVTNWVLAYQQASGGGATQLGKDMFKRQ